MSIRIGPSDPPSRIAGAKAAAPVARGRAADELALKKSADSMEGLFVQQLFQAMRASVPTDGLMERGPGEDMFSSMLDEHIAGDVARRDNGPRDLSTSLFESLRERLGPPADTVR
ncbi:MAG: rod-binding protein [Gemmatimonadetes bacterium]|nr:rod-binding protein [Gemmatimonadota bacterium]